MDASGVAVGLSSGFDDWTSEGAACGRQQAARTAAQEAQGASMLAAVVAAPEVGP